MCEPYRTVQYCAVLYCTAQCQYASSWNTIGKILLFEPPRHVKNVSSNQNKFFSFAAVMANKVSQPHTVVLETLTTHIARALENQLCWPCGESSKLYKLSNSSVLTAQASLPILRHYQYPWVIIGYGQ